MSDAIKPADLRPGDVLLYHGDSFLSGLIRLFDGSTYSHAAICKGPDGVLEAIGSGIELQPVAASVGGAKFVDVYRFISRPGRERLGSGSFPADPVIQRIGHYHDNRQRYAYEQLLLLALLASTRRIPVVSWIPGLNLIIRNILDSAAGMLARLMARGQEPMICSELVYRCYGEAGGASKYELAIRGADVLMPSRAADVASLAAAGVPQVMAAYGAGPSAEALDPLLPEKAAFLAEYATAAGLGPAHGVAAAGAGGPGAPGGVTAAAVPHFVTPRDLSRSPNLFRAGRLVA